MDKVKQMLGKVGGWLAQIPARVVASIYAFIASPKVWVAGAVFFSAGWVAAYIVSPTVNIRAPSARPIAAVSPAPVPAAPAAPSGTDMLLRDTAAKLAQATADLEHARAWATAAEKRAVAAEEALKAKPKVVYRTAKPAAADKGVLDGINWPKLP